MFSFFVLTFFVYNLDKFLRRSSLANALACGIPFAIALLIRPTNAFYLFLFILYDVYTFKSLKERIIWLLKNTQYLLFIALIVLIVFIPQMLYWHATVGKYFVYSYTFSYGGTESFIYWNSPKIGYVLFGVESGWLVYTPFFFIFFIGLLWALIKRKINAPAILILFILILYANASWWCYTFSCSYGHRAFIEYYPVFLIPVAFCFQQVYILRKKVVSGILIFLLALFLMANIRFTKFYFEDGCWIRPGWTWVNYNRALNKAFYIIPQSRNLK